MDKQVYIALENWESYNDSIYEILDTVQEFSTKNFVTATLLQELTRLVEERFVAWQKIQAFGFTGVTQARAALWRENERREQSHELSKEA